MSGSSEALFAVSGVTPDETFIVDTAVTGLAATSESHPLERSAEPIA